MNSKPLVAALAGTIILAMLGFPSHAFSLRDLLGMDEEESTPADASGGLMDKSTPEPLPAGAVPEQNWGKPSAAGGAKVPLDLNGVQKILANVDASQRAAVLADEATFKRFVQREADAASLLQAAKSNNLQQDANVGFLMQRGAENILREVYLNRLVTSKVPAGFPTEEQMKQYFEQNKEKLVVPERVQVWQVFFPLAKEMDAKAKGALGQKADSLARDLAQNKITFADAAQKFSAHEPSRQKGGDMGLVSVADLKPEIKQALLALPEEQISSPLKTDAGIHILKRGAKVAAQPLQYAAIKDQIRPLMLKQANAQLRNAILDQARKSYPVELDEKKIEELRLRLRTDLVSPNEKAAAAAKP